MSTTIRILPLALSPSRQRDCVARVAGRQCGARAFAYATLHSHKRRFFLPVKLSNLVRAFSRRCRKPQRGSNFQFHSTNDALNNQAARRRRRSDERQRCAFHLQTYNRAVGDRRRHRANKRNSQARAFFANSPTASITWPCGRDSARSAQRRDHLVLVSFANHDWVSPISFNFTTRMNTRSRRGLSPIIRSTLAAHTFDRKCGQDNERHTDLAVKPILLNMT